VKVGNPADGADMGPISYEGQWNKVQSLLKKGVAEGATLVTGGPGKPQGLEKGYYVKPTIFANVTNNMTIAREEIFGPVLSILGYDSEEQAIEIGNDTPYGLAAYVQGGDISRARKVASRLSAGQVSINGAGGDFSVPFGGYKQSGNGREWGEFGLDEYLELKAVVGYAPAD
jgi:aldehyde dehydrogenase (NAD+)